MIEKSVFEFSSYKNVMKDLIKRKGVRGALSRTAEALNCQRSYLSRVMSSELHLTLDQAFLFSKFWKMSVDERDYFRTLVEYERAADRTYREELQAKLNLLKKKHETLSERINRPPPSLLDQTLYFSTWYWSAIHFLTSSPRYQTPQSISEKLMLPLPLVIKCLEQLKAWCFVRQIGARWEYEGGEFHLPNNAPQVVAHHQNWRTRGVLDSQMDNSESVHYTNVQALSSGDILVIKEMLLKFISDVNKTMGPSSPEEAIVLTCDFFKL